MEHSKFGFLSVIASATSLALSVIAVIVCINVSGRTKTDYDNFIKSVETREITSADETNEMKSNDEPAAIINLPKYTAKTEGDSIVFRNESGDPVKTIDDFKMLLTDEDAEAFSKGIDIFSDEELALIFSEFEN